MTIEELRSALRRKVVPEEVVPQNVISCLIDEEAEPPKPDAFTFLMRLRALGIGSTDFVNLLEGCGAPEGVVAKIKQNPAMNLQGLILTLENSELDSDDYTRMLLTARQVWERTLTLRLEKSETLSHIIDDYENEEASQIPDEEPQISDEEPVEEVEYEEEFDPEYDEDMREMSFTAVFEKITAEIKAGKITPSDNDETSDEPEESSDESTDRILDKFHASSPAKTEPEIEDDAVDLSFTAAFDKIKAEKKLAFAEEHSDIHSDNHADTQAEKTAERSLVLDKIVEKAPEIIEEKIPEKFEEEIEITPEPEPIKAPEPVKKPAKNPMAEEIIKTARQKERSRILEEIRQDEEEAEKEEEPDEEDYDEEYDEEYDDVYEDDEYEDDFEDGNKPRSSNNGRKGAIIWAASGAAILICAGAVIGVTIGKNGANKSKSLDYAKDSAEIFNKIAKAYGAETPGGEAPSELSPDYSTLFGDLLISGEGGSSLGSFTLGTEIYSVTEGAISANVFENGTMRSLSDVSAPENARFVAAFDEGGKLYALFSGKQSGYVKVSGGKAEYTVKQDGVLTDYEFADGEMRLGTVYTPVFTESFTIEDESTYLPKTGTAELSALLPENIIMTDTTGYSYGVSAGYSAENGERKTICAVIGNPVAASADGRFALNSDEDGLLVDTSGKSPETRSTGKLLRAAFCKDGAAIFEEKAASNGAESGSESNSNTDDANKVTLLNGDLKPAAILSGVPEKITGMWFDGGILTINGDGNSILRVDCAELEKPNPLTLKTVVGVTAEHSALTLEKNGTSLVITRYDLENGKAVKLCEYAEELPSEQLATLKLGDPKTAVISGGTSGVAYSYFDGVSVVSDYVVFASGQAPKIETLYDDSTGFTAAFANGGKISAVCGEGVKTL